MGDLYNAANLQQQMQGLQPIVDYGAGQRQLAETLLKQRMDEDARRSLLTWEYRQRLAAQAQQQNFERQQSEARNTFTAGENVKEQAAREKLAIASQNAWMDRVRENNQDDIRKAELADRRKQASSYKKEGVFQKPGEDIDEYFQRAEKEIDDKQNAQIDSTAERYAGMQNNLDKLTVELEQDKQAALRKAGIRAVKNSGLLNDEQKKLFESGGKNSISYETFLASNLKPDLRNKIEEAFQEGADAAKAIYTWPVDKKVREQQLIKHINDIEKFVVPGLMKKGEDYSRFYDKTLGAGGQPLDYNRTVQGQINPIAAFQADTNKNVAAQRSFGVTGDFSALPKVTPEYTANPSVPATNPLPERLSFDDFNRFIQTNLDPNQGKAAVEGYWRALGRRFGFPAEPTTEDYYGGSVIAKGSILGDARADSARRLFQTHPEIQGQINQALKADPNLESDLYKSALIDATRVPRGDRGTDFFGNPVANSYGIAPYSPSLPSSAVSPVAPRMPAPITAAPPIVQSAPPGYFPAQPVPEFNPYIPLIPYR